MNSALGTGGLVMGLVAAIGGMLTLGVGLHSGQRNLLVAGRAYAWMTLLGAAVAFAAMERALITRDYTLRYVAENGGDATPPLYNFAALWSALEGSILLWALILTGFTAAIAHRFRRRFDDPLVGWALLTMLGICVFFFSLMLFPGTGANPFERVDVGPNFVGDGPNPLLQNHWLMAIHPPVLYLGYVGFSVPFAFAVAALVTGRLGEGWLLETRRWTLIAWGCLTTGIILGGWWSYAVLGWGGYWAWDPVENASLLPWLTGTAYLHSVMVQERRGMLRVWNLSLLCATFSLTILGTFLTRSGTLDSVHSFTQSGIGPWLLGFFGLVVAVSLGLIGWRGDRLRSPGRIDSPASREGAFLANNVLFAGFAFVVLLGTVFPLIVEALNDERLSIGRPYFDRMTMPIGMALLFMMAVAPVLPWRKASGELLSKRLFWPAWAGTGSMVLAVVLGARGLAPLLAFGLGGFAAGAALRQVVLATRRSGWRGLVGRANGGMIVHLGVVLVAVALAASNSYDTETEVTLTPGQSAPVGDDHQVTYLGMREESDDVKDSTLAQVELDGELMEPSLSRFGGGNQMIGTPDIASGFTEDVYLALVRTPEGTAAGDPVVLRVIVQPLVRWLWIGGAVMAMGTLLAAFPGRRRDPLAPTSAPVVVADTDPSDSAEPAEVGSAAAEKVEVGV